MTKITVLGGTGFTGGNIVKEAAIRGFEVTSVSRNLPEQKIDSVNYVTASLDDNSTHQSLIENADIIIGTLAPRGDLESKVLGIYTHIATLAAEKGTRLAIVGGFSALRPAEGAPRFAEGNDIPPQYAAEAKVMFNVLEYLETEASEDLDWTYVSPAAVYGSHVPGEATGKYRIGGHVALFDEKGDSAISGDDFALAVVDAIEKPAHRREQISFAY